MSASRVIVAALLTVPLLAAPGSTGSAQEGDVQRLFGPTRIETATAISQADFPDAASASVVVLARAYAFPDALAGAPYAVARGGPLLLTTIDGLHAATAEEIQRVLPAGGTVVLLGGTAALSVQVERDVEALGYAVERLWGQNRFETSVAIAEATSATPSQVWVADGTTFADALLAGAAAAGHAGTLVLSNGTSLEPSVREYVDRADDVWAVGPVGAALGLPTNRRFDGADAYERGAALAADAALYDPSATPGFAVASGEKFPDGLAGGAFAGRRGIPLVLATSQTLGSSRPGVEQFEGLSYGVLFGGGAALEESVASEVAEVLADSAPAPGSGWVPSSGDVIIAGQFTTSSGQNCYPEYDAGCSNHSGREVFVLDPFNIEYRVLLQYSRTSYAELEYLPYTQGDRLFVQQQNGNVTEYDPITHDNIVTSHLDAYSFGSDRDLGHISDSLVILGDDAFARRYSYGPFADPYDNGLSRWRPWNGDHERRHFTEPFSGQWTLHGAGGRLYLEGALGELEGQPDARWFGFAEVDRETGELGEPTYVGMRDDGDDSWVFATDDDQPGVIYYAAFDGGTDIVEVASYDLATQAVSVLHRLEVPSVNYLSAFDVDDDAFLIDPVGTDSALDAIVIVDGEATLLDLPGAPFDMELYRVD